MVARTQSDSHPAAPRAGTRGVALVEMSLIGLLFLMILIGILDFAQSLFLQQALLERARAAARWGAVNNPADTEAIRNMVLYRQSTVPTDRGASFGLTAAMVSVSTPDSGTDNYRLVLTISGYSYRMLSPYLARSYRGAPITVSIPLGLYG